MKKVYIVMLTVMFLLVSGGVSRAELLHSAALRNGNYGDGSAIDTMDPIQGDSPHVLGIVDSSYGVAFTSTESDGRSNALIDWQITDEAKRVAFKSAGTVSFLFKADRQLHVGGSVFGDNYGFDKFNNGQGSFDTSAFREDYGTPTKDDDKVRLQWHAWINNVWYNTHDPNLPRLEYDRWYYVGFAWGGPVNDFEIWVDGTLISAVNLPGGVDFPWGQEFPWAPSAINVGLGSNHQRGYIGYGSVAGVSFADIHIWNEYRALGGTKVPFEDAPFDYWAYNFIMGIYNAGITGGCSADPPLFCPDNSITRGQMAVFMEASLGVTTIPPCTGTVFNDVNAGTVGPAFCGFIEDFAARGITGGCGGGNYCPSAPVTRWQMAVFIEAALGRVPGQLPPTCSGTFNDVNASTVGDYVCRMIEDFALQGITGGCGGGNFCPSSPVTRAQMGVFLVAAPQPLNP